jgi:hypothetical protein
MTKNSNEAEYRIIFDNLISDLLVVLYWPEWPAASLLLSIACKYMVSESAIYHETSQSMHLVGILFGRHQDDESTGQQCSKNYST